MGRGGRGMTFLVLTREGIKEKGDSQIRKRFTKKKGSKPLEKCLRPPKRRLFRERKNSREVKKGKGGISSRKKSLARRNWSTGWRSDWPLLEKKGKKKT